MEKLAIMSFISLPFLKLNKSNSLNFSSQVLFSKVLTILAALLWILANMTTFFFNYTAQKWVYYSDGSLNSNEENEIIILCLAYGHICSVIPECRLHC